MRSAHESLATLVGSGAMVVTVALAHAHVASDPTSHARDASDATSYERTSFPRQDAGLDILFVGNSLTYWNRLPEVLAGLFDDAGVARGRFETVAFPDYGLQDHWGSGPRGPARSAIADGGWDVVVLQQGPSATQGRPSLLQYAELFAAEIRAIGAVPALYMVWPSRERDFDFDGVSDSYRRAAEEVDGYLFPAGEAWREAWQRDADVDLYGPDGFHPSVLGTYLAALVMFEQLAGRDPRTLPATFRTPNGTVELPIGAATLLQEAAAEANQRFARFMAGVARSDPLGPRAR